MRELRFYEKDPTVRRAVEALFLFPAEIQRVLASGFTLIAERDFKMKEVENRGKNLGASTVLSLHKSKQKNRPYDNCPVTHKALNYLMMMSPESRIFLSCKIIELMGFMQEYLKLCESCNVLPDDEVVQEISDTYHYKGAAEARVFITVLSREFKQRLLKAVVDPVQTVRVSDENAEKLVTIVESEAPSETSGEAIQVQQSGMKIKGEL